ncbi:MAG: hypothetical protein K9W42_09905 [Candidatus Heimdallarchaeota archaeon]|nr:hypothetical protein [Candidatus Heimdallarchaeota archaeon]
MAETMELKSTVKIDEEKLTRIIHFLGAILCYLIVVALTFNPYWQLTIIAGILGGAFFLQLRKGALVGTIAVGLAWGTFLLIKLTKTNVGTLLAQMTGILLGNEQLSWLIILVIILVGALLGAVSGVIGSGMRLLFQNFLEKRQKSQQHE